MQQQAVPAPVPFAPGAAPSSLPPAFLKAQTIVSDNAAHTAAPPARGKPRVVNGRLALGQSVPRATAGGLVTIFGSALKGAGLSQASSRTLQPAALPAEKPAAASPAAGALYDAVPSDSSSAGVRSPENRGTDGLVRFQGASGTRDGLSAAAAGADERAHAADHQASRPAAVHQLAANPGGGERRGAPLANAGGERASPQQAAGAAGSAPAMAPMQSESAAGERPAPPQAASAGGSATAMAPAPRAVAGEPASGVQGTAGRSSSRERAQPQPPAADEPAAAAAGSDAAERSSSHASETMHESAGVGGGRDGGGRSPQSNPWGRRARGSSLQHRRLADSRKRGRSRSPSRDSRDRHRQSRRFVRPCLLACAVNRTCLCVLSASGYSSSSVLALLACTP